MAPIPRPRKNIFCVGKNYYDHAVEFGKHFEQKKDAASSIPEHPVVFSKLPTAVVGLDDFIDCHARLNAAGRL